jgi:hypothetical protein
MFFAINSRGYIVTAHGYDFAKETARPAGQRP